MDHVELKPYPFPAGMEIPRLMPAQEFPWNGDGYLAAEVLRLKAVHGLEVAIETGTCLGSTALWLAENFSLVDTCEINPEYYKIAAARLGCDTEMDCGASGIEPMVNIENMDSQDALELFVQSTLCESVFVFLDAHWNDHCPLLEELEIIAELGAKPCIIIHDFHVPGTTFGFDSMPDGTPFHLELVAPYMDRIYGEGGWKHNYPTKVEGANRGWISVEPVLD